MSTTLLLPPDKLEFSKSGKFLADKVAANIQLSGPDPALLLAIAGNSVFPSDKAKVGSITSRVSGDSGSIKFGDNKGIVSFKAGGGVDVGFGAYTKASALLADLDPEDNILTGIDLPQTGVARYVVLNWGYDIQGSVKGSVALGFGTSLKFGADGQSTGFFAVIRAFEAEPGARDAIQSIIDGWMLPRQVETVRDLAPGTWVVAEVDGEFAATLGVQFGYDYSWLRNVSLQGLSGDVGLRIAASAAISMGFNVSGKYLVAVTRESLREEDQVARVRLYKMAKKGWNFALNASVSVTTSTGRFLPGELDDFVAGVFGVHGAQLVKDLKKFRAWTDPSVPLEEKLAGFVSAYVAKQLKNHAGDLVAKVNEARTRIQNFLNKWDELPHKASSLLWTTFRQGGKAAASFEEALRLIADGTDGQIKEKVVNVLSDVEFFRSPIGQWLEAIATGNLLTVAVNNAEIKKVRDAAKKAVEVLDGKVLEELAAFVNEKLRIDLVRDIVDKASLDNLETWLKAKLTAFLGKELDLNGLKEVQKTLHFLDTKAAELYKAAREALNKTWTASVVYNYSSATTKTALLDISFDFNANPGLGDALINVINGNWNSTLLGRPAGVTINQAVLTHAVKRQSHFELTLPYYNTALDKFNESTATMTFASEDGGVYLYELAADDKITRRRKWQSAASITSKIAIKSGANVNVFPTEEELASSSTYSYTLRLARKDLRTPQLEQQFDPIARRYFPKAFSGPKKASFGEWIADLDKHADQVENNGTFNLGNTLLKLDVALPGKCVAAWYKAPSRKATRVPYQAMSRNIQRSLRDLIPLCYFDEPRKYAAAEFDIAAQVLVYSAIPVSTGIKLVNGQITFDADVKKLFWEYDDPREPARNQRHAMIFNVRTKESLRKSMRDVRALLERVPDLSNFAADYDETDARIDTLRSRSYRDNEPNMLIMKLLRNESMTIDRAVEAGEALADFRVEAVDDPEAALASLAEFGAKITETFNSQLSDLFGGPVLRALGSMIFLEAARAFDSLEDLDPVARLDITILRSSAPKTWREDFLAAKNINPEFVALEQLIVNI